MTVWTELDEEVTPAPPPMARVDVFLPFQGFIDQFGYHMQAGGWFFVGWLLGEEERPELDTDAVIHGVAHFDDEESAGWLATLFYERTDVDSRAVGFVFFMPAAFAADSPLHHLTIEIDGIERDLHLLQATQLPHCKLVPFLQQILRGSEPGPRHRNMARLAGQLAGAEAAPRVEACIEFYGFHALAEGWFISGWLSQGWPQNQRPEAAFIAFDDGDLRGEAGITLYARQDLPEGARGFVLFIRGDAAPSFGTLRMAGFRIDGDSIAAQPIDAARHFATGDLVAHAQSSLALASPSRQRDRLSNLLARQGYRGDDTLAALGPEINFYIDEAILCGSGLLLMGWTIARPGEAFEVRIRCGTRSSALHLRDSLRIERHDVFAEFGRKGFDELNCGFVAFLPAAVEGDEPVYLEVKTMRGEIGYRPVPLSARSGMAGIKHVLGAVQVSSARLQRAFDTVLGPAVDALNAARMAAPVQAESVDYGALPEAPRVSVIVPLYGRLDFMEYQMALFSAHPAARQVEFIYVLDDPPKQHEAERLFASVYQRFLLPFRVVLPNRNLGFAPASNLGLARARGRYVGFLNSDVFPGTLDWLEQLIARLDSDPGLGLVGPLLLFDDQTVQHKGMFFERLPQFANWFFCQHEDKGRRATEAGRLERPLVITGACMVMTAELARRLGGFDEGYVIGDFEDSDLCLRAHELGLGCGIDTGVRMFHLERKSQDNPGFGWRMNATAYNAWRHDRRWRQTIATLQSSGSAP